MRTSVTNHVTQRRAVKKSMEAAPWGSVERSELDQIQAAYKVLCNAVYGFNGALISALSIESIAKAIVILGRTNLQRLRQSVRELSQNVVYSEPVMDARTVRVERVAADGSKTLVTVDQLCQAAGKDVVHGPGWKVIRFNPGVVINFHDPLFYYNRPAVFVEDIEAVRKERAVVEVASTVVDYLPQKDIAGGAWPTADTPKEKWTREVHMFPKGTPRDVQLASEHFHASLNITEGAVVVGVMVENGVPSFILQDRYAAERGLVSWPVLSPVNEPPAWLRGVRERLETGALEDLPPMPTKDAVKAWSEACADVIEREIAAAPVEFWEHPVTGLRVPVASPRTDGSQTFDTTRSEDTIKYGDTDSVMPRCAREALPGQGSVLLETRLEQALWAAAAVRVTHHMGEYITSHRFDNEQTAELESLLMSFQALTPKRYIAAMETVAVNKATKEPVVRPLFVRDTHETGLPPSMTRYKKGVQWKRTNAADAVREAGEEFHAVACSHAAFAPKLDVVVRRIRAILDHGLPVEKLVKTAKLNGTYKLANAVTKAKTTVALEHLMGLRSRPDVVYDAVPWQVMVAWQMGVESGVGPGSVVGGIVVQPEPGQKRLNTVPVEHYINHNMTFSVPYIVSALAQVFAPILAIIKHGGDRMKIGVSSEAAAIRIKDTTRDLEKFLSSICQSSAQRRMPTVPTGLLRHMSSVVVRCTKCKSTIDGQSRPLFTPALRDPSDALVVVKRPPNLCATCTPDGIAEAAVRDVEAAIDNVAAAWGQCFTVCDLAKDDPAKAVSCRNTHCTFFSRRLQASQSFRMAASDAELAGAGTINHSALAPKIPPEVSAANISGEDPSNIVGAKQLWDVVEPSKGLLKRAYRGALTP